jgi:steroid delta-isomerase-like uncharacterized protein
MRREDLRQLATDVVEAFNDGDWERQSQLAAPQVVYQETGTDRRTDTVDTYVGALQDWKQAVPDIHAQLRTLLVDEETDTIACQITWTGNHTGPYSSPTQTFQPSGRPVHTTSALFFTVENGLITHVRHFLLPPFGSGPYKCC